MSTRNAINSGKPIEVTLGGTGVATLTDHGVLVGSGISEITVLSVGTTGQLLVGSSSADPSFAATATGDFTFTSSTASQTRVVTVVNTDNTGAATSAARLDLTVGGSNVADPQIRYGVSGVTTWSTGIDNNDSDKFKMSLGNTLGTTDVFVSTVAGEITMPLQPAFGAVASNQSDVTGDGTAYTLTYSSSEYFDQNNDFDGTSTFTAPVTGKYQFNGVAYISSADITSSHTTGTITLSTSNRDYVVGYINPYAAGPTSGYAWNVSMLVDMDSSDTAVIKLTVSGGTKVIDVIGANSFFNAYLAC